MMMIELERRRKPIRRVSMVAMVDVVLMILIFFLMAGSFQAFDVIDVTPPVASSGKALSQGPIVVLLGRYDEIVINDDPQSLNEVQATLRKLLKDNPKRIVTIKADARMNAERMIALMDEIKQAGAINVSLVTIGN